MSPDASFAFFRESDVARVLRRARMSYVAIETKTGPHVTPELYAWIGQRFWIATARRTLKARSLETGTTVGLLLRDDNLSLAVSGTARPFDPLDPSSFLAARDEMLLAPTGASGFVIRNWRHLLGFLRQGWEAVPWSPGRLRTLVSIEPHAAALFDGNVLVEEWGRWPERKVRTSSARRGAPQLEHVPVPAGHLAGEEVDHAAIGWSTSHGPVALPASWDGSNGTCEVSPDALGLVGAPARGRVAVVLEDMKGFDMTGKTGLMLRGEATVTEAGDTATVTVAAESAVGWEGVTTRSTSVG